MKAKGMRRMLVRSVGPMLLAGFFMIGSQALCQEQEEDGGLIVFTRPVKAVVFDHKVHVEDQGLDCDSCHDDPFEMAAGTAEENGDFTMKSLYEGRYCGACHDGETAFASNTRCTACHIGVKGYNRIMGPGAEGDGAGEGHH